MDLTSLRFYLQVLVQQGGMSADVAFHIYSMISNWSSDPAYGVGLFNYMISQGLTMEQISAIGSMNQQINIQPTVTTPDNFGDNPIEQLLSDFYSHGIYSMQEINELRSWLTEGTEQQALTALRAQIDLAVNSGVLPAPAADSAYRSILNWLYDGNAAWSRNLPTPGGGGTVTPSFSYVVQGRTVTISVSNGQSFNYYHYMLTTASSAAVVNETVYRTRYTYSSLVPGTEYTVKVAYSNSPVGTNEVWLPEKTFTAPSVAANIVSFTASQNGEGKLEAAYSFSALDVSPGASYTVSVGVPGVGQVTAVSGVLRRGLYGYASANGAGTIQLGAYRSYTLILTIVNQGNASATKTTAVTLSPKGRPEHFSWTAANYPEEDSATAAQTRAAYNAVTGHGKLTDFSYLVWNDLCHRVKDAADSSGSSWNSAYLSYENTLMSERDKAITATRFNSLNYNIRLRYETGIGAKSKGDHIIGSFFTTMVDSLNGWIDSIPAQT